MDEQYKGTTVNERLYISGQLDAFDKAVVEKDFERIRLIHSEVELGNENVNGILSQLGLN